MNEENTLIIVTILGIPESLLKCSEIIKIDLKIYQKNCKTIHSVMEKLKEIVSGMEICLITFYYSICHLKANLFNQSL